jgi:O-methyltransferase
VGTKDESFYARYDPWSALRSRVKRLVPERFHRALRPLNRGLLDLYNGVPHVNEMLPPPDLPGLSFSQRFRLAARFDRISRHVRCSHSDRHMFAFCREVVRRSEVPGCILEAGSFKGGSAAKFSLLADLIDRRVEVFDSFQGIPANRESNIDGQTEPDFAEGSYAGSLEEVRANIDRHGVLSRCAFHEGWFEDTLPGFREPIAAAYVDVDLAASTRTVLEHVYPLLSPGGFLMSQDGHIPRVVEVLEDERFWRDEVGAEPPRMQGLGSDQLVFVFKPSDA